jgi:glycosyltransferase involved in cell wall biosynthesis
VNVLYLSYDGALDPLGRSQVIPYLEGLSALGHRFDLITFEKQAQWAEIATRDAMARRLRDADIAWHPLRYHKRFSAGATSFDLGHARAVAGRLVKRRRIDLLHARSYPPAFVARLVARHHGLPYLFDMRGLYPEERVDGGIWPAGGTLFRVAKRAEASLLRDAAGVVTLTERSVPVVQSMMERAGSKASLDVIRTCVDLNRFAPAGVPTGQPVLAYLGSLGTWYLLDEMLRFAAAAAEHARARVRMIVNDEGGQLTPMLTAAGLTPDQVEIASVPYDRVPALLVDVTATFAFYRVAPSRVATAPTKVSESWAMGLPAAVNDGVGDAADLVRQEGAGVVVDPAAPASFPEHARALVAMGRDAAVRRRCRAVAERHFDMAEAARSYDRIYADMLSRPSMRR